MVRLVNSSDFERLIRMYLSIMIILTFAALYGYICYSLLLNETWFWTFIVLLSLMGMLFVAPEKKIWRTLQIVKEINKFEIFFLILFSAIALDRSAPIAANFARWLSMFIFFLSFRLISKKLVRLYLRGREKGVQ
jgi:hypothetical protein